MSHDDDSGPPSCFSTSQLSLHGDLMAARKTGTKAAKNASKTLTSKSTSSKSAAGSALSQKAKGAKKR